MSEKISVSDLSIGDWVRYDRGTDAVQIIGIYVRNNQECVVMSDTYYSDGVIGFVENIKPIPITPEILKKNGFEDHFEFTKYSQLISSVFISKLDATKKLWVGRRDSGWSLLITKRRGTRYFMQFRVRVEYIHQLQHALRLAGIEKQIELE